MPSLRPAEVWRRRLDEAVVMLAAKGALLNQGRSSSGGGGGGGNEKRYTERPDGTREYAIDSMGTLKQFLSTGNV